jgi:surface polysaccharide O-acyltransferase-like enzyme
MGETVGDSLEPKPAANYSVDLIRFIAIIGIILVHTSGYPYPIPGPGITSTDIVYWFTTDVYNALGTVGVPLFVMLTGALLLDPVKANESLKVFYKKRFDRIAWPFVFWTVFYFAWDFSVRAEPLTLFNVGQGLLTGAYPHLWYIYLLMGLYAVTPILRILLKHLDRRLFTYLLLLWFAGTVLTPFIHTFTNFTYDPVTFVFFDWVGYFLLGIYLLGSNFKRQTGYLFAAVGILGATIGDWLLTATAGEHFTGYLHNYMSATMIVGSAGLFLLLITVRASAFDVYPRVNRVVHWVSQNTLPIYLIHMIVLEALTTQVFGVYLNTLTYNPLIDIPLYTLLVFSVSAAIVFGLKRIPGAAKIIG